VRRPNKGSPNVNPSVHPSVPIWTKLGK